jgi:hypothetical protein
MKALQALIPALSLLVLGGCVRSTSVSEITPEGTVKRSLSVTINEMGGGEEKGEDYLVLASPGQWKQDTQTKPGTIIYSATRTAALGAPKAVEYRLTDGKKGKGKAKVEIQTKKLPDGGTEYTETWTWEGESGKTLSSEITTDIKPMLDKQLKPIGADEAKVEAAALAMTREAIRALMGPGEPLLMTVIAQPEEGLRQFRRRLYLGLAGWISRELPSVTEEKGKAAAKAWAMDLQSLLEKKQNDTKTSEEPPNSGGQLVLAQSAIQGLGDVVETNGIIDEVDGRVYWSMYLEACSNEPVVLRAVFKK